MQEIYIEEESLYNRPEVNELIEDLNVKTLIDVGGSWNPIKTDKLTHMFDMHDPKLPNVKWFQGNINSYEGWKPVLDYVEENGKFDFCNCTHTLEDVAYPEAALRYMPMIAKTGFIAVPSKYWELDRRQLFRGGHHHRWIFNNENNQLVLYPKINLIEYMIPYNEYEDNIKKYKSTELRMVWQDEIDFKIINNDYLGPTFEDVVSMYHGLVIDK